MEEFEAPEECLNVLTFGHSSLKKARLLSLHLKVKPSISFWSPSLMCSEAPSGFQYPTFKFKKLLKLISI